MPADTGQQRPAAPNTSRPAPLGSSSPSRQLSQIRPGSAVDDPAPSAGGARHERRWRPYRRADRSAAPVAVWPGSLYGRRGGAAPADRALSPAVTVQRVGQHRTCTHLHPGHIVRSVSKKALLFSSIYEATRCEVINTRCDLSISESNAYLVFNRALVAGAGADCRGR